MTTKPRRQHPAAEKPMVRKTAQRKPQGSTTGKHGRRGIAVTGDHSSPDAEIPGPAPKKRRGKCLNLIQDHSSSTLT
jgi:hypothetical protein